MAKRTIPAISIVIPMYNAEKYVGECLDSILAQTFDDYEVIVVDDCSTDNSVAIVESYVPKFARGGAERLQLIRRKTNSGGDGVPRNTGIRIARGEYLMFIDIDDAVMSTACEEFYSIASKFDADVVHFDKYYVAVGDTVSVDKNLLKEVKWGLVKPVNEPKLMSDNIADRIQSFGRQEIFWTPWSNFIRRDFLMRNDLTFPDVSVACDLLFSVFVLCTAKNFVRIPNVFYVWRSNPSSLTRASLTADERIHRFAGSIFKGIEILDKFMDKFEIFRQNMAYKYLIFEVLTGTNLKAPHQVIPAYVKIPAFQLDYFVRQEIDRLSDKTALTSFLFSRMNIFNINIIQYQQLLQHQQQQIQQLQSQIQQLQSQLKQLQQTQPAQFHLNTEDIFK